MLTGDLVRPRLHKYDGELRVKLLDATDRRSQHTAAALIALFQQQVGRSFGAWEEALAHYEGDRTDYVVVRGLAKVLADAATYVACETPVPPAEIRAALFARGPAFGSADLLHPSHTRRPAGGSSERTGAAARAGGGLPLCRSSL